MVVLTGVGAGLFGAALMALLTTVEHLGFGYDSGSFQSGVEQASGARRPVALGVAGVIGGVGWYLLRRRVDVRNMAGGMKAWAQAGLPITTDDGEPGTVG